MVTENEFLKLTKIADWADCFVKTNKIATITFNENDFGEPTSEYVWTNTKTNDKYVCVYNRGWVDFYKIIPNCFHSETNAQMVKYYITLNTNELIN